MDQHCTADVEILLSACRLALGTLNATVPAPTPDAWDAAIPAAHHHGLIWPLENLSKQVDGLPDDIRHRIRAAAQAQASQTQSAQAQPGQAQPKPAAPQEHFGLW